MNDLISNYRKMIASLTMRSLMFGISISTEECMIMALLGMYITLILLFKYRNGRDLFMYQSR